MKLTNELKNLIPKWKKILKLEDWNLEVVVHNDKEYRKIENLVGFEPGTTKGMNTTTEEQQHSLIFLNSNTGKEGVEWYLVHELNHSLINEIEEFSSILIEMLDNEEIKSILKSRRDDIIEKLVWKYTRIVLDLDKKEGEH